MTTKAKIETFRIMEGCETFTTQISFPEFKGPGSDPITMTFETTLPEYIDWVPPGEVDKSPETFIEYEYVRPTHAKLALLNVALGSLEGIEYDW